MYYDRHGTSRPPYFQSDEWQSIAYTTRQILGRQYRAWVDADKARRAADVQSGARSSSSAANQGTRRVRTQATSLAARIAFGLLMAASVCLNVAVGCFADCNQSYQPDIDWSIAAPAMPLRPKMGSAKSLRWISFCVAPCATCFSAPRRRFEVGHGSGSGL